MPPQKAIAKCGAALVWSLIWVFGVAAFDTNVPIAFQPLLRAVPFHTFGARAPLIRVKQTNILLMAGADSQETRGSLQKAYVSKSLSKILQEQQSISPPGNSQKDHRSRGSWKKLFIKLIQKIFVRPGEIVGRWVLTRKYNNAAAIDKESLPVGREEEGGNLRAVTSDEDDFGNLGTDRIVSVPTPQPPSARRETQPLQKAERVDLLMNRYSAKRLDESPRQDNSERRDAPTNPANPVKASSGQDRNTLLLDSYARRHKEGEDPLARESIKAQQWGGQRKPILRSQYAQKEDELAERTDFKNTPNETKASSTKNTASRLDLLINRYADRASTRQPSGRMKPIVRKGPATKASDEQEGS